MNERENTVKPEGVFEKDLALSRSKLPSNFKDWIIWIIALAFAVFHLHTAITGSLLALYQRSIHFAFAGCLVFLICPSKTKNKRLVVPLKIWDVFLSLCAVLPVLYLLINEDIIINRFYYIQKLSWYEYALCAMLLLAVLEGTRRKMGKALPIIAIIAMVYMLFGKYLPGFLGNGGFSTIAFVDTLYMTTEGIFGIALGASATFVVLFIIFGSFLEFSGVGEYFIRVARTCTKNSVGGPAKAAVISSCLFGSISGSTIANVATTGQITIPLMKRNGYSAEFAGAVEAVSSTGGQIMPPVMGAAAFIMAEYTGIPYGRIILAALIPGLLYYLSVFVMVHFEAKKLGLKPEKSGGEELSFKNLIKDAYLFLPLVILIVYLVLGYSATYAVLRALVAILIVSLFKKKTRLGFKQILNCLVKGAKGTVTVALACACAGIVVGIVNYTGLGTRLSSLMSIVAGNSLFLALIITAIAAMILGMGLPTTPAYIIVATLLVRTIKSFGISNLAAHLFAFYFANISAITPPVALAAYTAAGISGANPIKTGYKAFALGITSYIVPFMFVYNPVLLFDFNNVFTLFQAIVTSCIGIYFLAIASEGYFYRKQKIWERLSLFAAAICMVDSGSVTDLVGLGILSVIALPQIIIEIKKRNKKTQGLEVR